MAKPKLRTIYHTFFCDDILGEADGFFEIDGTKLKYIAGWFCNDAHWRGEYMAGLLRHVGAEVKPLPDKYAKPGAKLMAAAFGLGE
jgi:hypothetical protein